VEHVGAEQPHKSNDYNGRCIKILTAKEAEQNQLLKISPSVTSPGPFITSPA